MRKDIVIASVLPLALVMTGCGGKIRYPQYYTLGVAPTPTPVAGDPPGIGTVAVSPFGTSAYLRQGRIVYREAPNQIAFYEYHRWAADPGATDRKSVV